MNWKMDVKKVRLKIEDSCRVGHERERPEARRGDAAPVGGAPPPALFGGQKLGLVLPPTSGTWDKV